jgi:hypothetical protein
MLTNNVKLGERVNLTVSSPSGVVGDLYQYVADDTVREIRKLKGAFSPN